MRLLLVFIVMILATVTKAQSPLQNGNGWFPPASIDGIVSQRIPYNDSMPHSKWSFSKYVSLSSGYSFFKGGSTSFFAAPIGVQLNRSLSNHLTAFAGVSVVPVYFNFNSAFSPNAFDKTNAGNPFFKTNNLNMYSKVELGLMYTNDAKTFSISGSIGVQKSSYPVFYPAATQKGQNQSILPNTLQ